MRRRRAQITFCVLVLSILMAVAQQSSAVSGPYRVFKTCQSLLMSQIAPVRVTPILLSEHSLSELRIAYSVYLAQKKLTKTFLNGDPVPKRLLFRGKEFRVEAYLESGGEGDVFQISDEDRIYVMKKFRSQHQMQRNMLTADLLNVRGINVLSSLQVDDQGLTVLYPYIHGLDMYEILGSDVYRNPMISESTRQSVQSAYNLFTAQVSSAYRSVHPDGLGPIKTNVMLDLDTLKFVIVDPL